jgi:hypothetical protein
MVAAVRLRDREPFRANGDAISRGPASPVVPFLKDVPTTAVAMEAIMPVPVSDWVWDTDHPAMPATLARVTRRPGLAERLAHHSVDHGVMDTVIASDTALVSTGKSRGAAARPLAGQDDAPGLARRLMVVRNSEVLVIV